MTRWWNSQYCKRCWERRFGQGNRMQSWRVANVGVPRTDKKNATVSHDFREHYFPSCQRNLGSAKCYSNESLFSNSNTTLSIRPLVSYLDCVRYTPTSRLPRDTRYNSSIRAFLRHQFILAPAIFVHNISSSSVRGLIGCHGRSYLNEIKLLEERQQPTMNALALGIARSAGRTVK